MHNLWGSVENDNIRTFVKKVRILKEWQQSVKSNIRSSMWRDPVWLNRLHAHEAALLMDCWKLPWISTARLISHQTPGTTAVQGTLGIIWFNILILQVRKLRLRDIKWSKFLNTTGERQSQINNHRYNVE